MSETSPTATADIIIRVRFWLFVKLAAFGWWLCPEPHRSRLQAAMPSWELIERLEAAKALELEKTGASS